MLLTLPKDIWTLILRDSDAATCAVAECVNTSARMNIDEWTLALHKWIHSHRLLFPLPYHVFDPCIHAQDIVDTLCVDWPTACRMATKRFVLQIDNLVNAEPSDSDYEFLIKALHSMLHGDTLSFKKLMTTKPHLMVRTYSSNSSKYNYLHDQHPHLILSDKMDQRSLVAHHNMHKLCWLGDNSDSVTPIGFTHLLLITSSCFSSRSRRIKSFKGSDKIIKEIFHEKQLAQLQIHRCRHGKIHYPCEGFALNGVFYKYVPMSVAQYLRAHPSVCVL